MKVKQRKSLDAIVGSFGSWLVALEQTDEQQYGKWVIELTNFADNLNFKRYHFCTKKEAMTFYKELNECCCSFWS